MGSSQVDRRWQEYLDSGQVTIGASVLKGMVGMVGLILLSMLSVGLAYDAFQEAGTSSLRAWGCAFASVLALVGVLVVAAPMVRRRRLEVTPSGLSVTSRRKGVRVMELTLRWDEINGITAHRSPNGEGASTVDVRMVLAPGVRTDHPTAKQYGYVDLPLGFRMSKRELAELLERVRLSRE